jgi:hypothetical protein
VSRELANCLPVVIVVKITQIYFIYDMEYYDINPRTTRGKGMR